MDYTIAHYTKSSTDKKQTCLKYYEWALQHNLRRYLHNKNIIVLGWWLLMTSTTTKLYNKEEIYWVHRRHSSCARLLCFKTLRIIKSSRESITRNILLWWCSTLRKFIHKNLIKLSESGNNNTHKRKHLSNIFIIG